MPAVTFRHKHDPDQPELRRLQRLVDINIPGGDELLRLDRGNVARRLPARRRDTHDRRTDQHETKIDDAHDHEGLRDSDMGGRREHVHEPHRKRGGDHRAAAEAHDRHAGRHSGPIRKPLHQRRYRRNIADAEACSPNHAIAKIDQPELTDRNPECADKKTAAKAQRGGEHGSTRPALLDPAAEHRRGNPEKDDGDRKNPAEFCELPVIGRRVRDADQLGHRQIEDAERVSLADAQMNA